MVCSHMKVWAGVIVHRRCLTNSVDNRKAVFGHQLKTVIRDVVSDPILTEDGEEVDAIFGYKSVDDRIVNSPALVGTTSILMDEITKRAVAMYFGES